MMIAAALSVVGATLPASLANCDERPNILFLLSDDQRADTISAFGNDKISTPSLDYLVKHGVSFRKACCMGSTQGAVCVPSRAMMMGGKSLFRTDSSLKSQVTFPALLASAGYDTFATGKWHNGKESFAASFAAGHSIMFGGMCDHLQVPLHDMNADRSFGEQRTGDAFSSTLFADAAIKFLETREGDNPFLCYVAFTAPHDPRMPPREFADRYRNPLPPLPGNFLPQHPFDAGDMTVRDEVLAAWPRTEDVVRQQLAEYYGMITHMDGQIGRIFDALDDQGLMENTIVIFASDHGLALGSHGLLGKQSVYDHSMHAPLIIAGPGIPAGTQQQALVYLHDIFPTICDFAKVPIPESVEGISLKKIIDGDTSEQRETLFTAYSRYGRAVRDQRWKLIRWPQVNKTQLFDLENDPDERYDVSNRPENLEHVIRLLAQLADWQKSVDDQQPLWVDGVTSGPVDLSEIVRKPDHWQPRSVVEKYFDKASADDRK